MSTGREIRLIEEDDGWWSAVDVETGVASQGRRARKRSKTSMKRLS
ncbi:hypothetical protein VB773_14920 [Haloarculaceae archaeon H-GB2-1]|nr:hypothetical protein [Haloarculaceae archaeon H-GB2-1]